jgi:HAD superfamily hydrolase (TIGR01509 family)
MGPIRGVILDVDGTLVDSNDAHARAFVDAFAEIGRPVPFERLRPLIGMGGDKLVYEAAGVAPEGPEGRAVRRRKKEIFKARYLPTLKAFPRAGELVDRLKQAGLRVAVASAADPDELEPLLALAGAAWLMARAPTKEEAPRSKPDPDAVAAARRKLGVPADQALMIGDTPYDVEAAREAGVRTIALLSGGWRPEALGEAIAIYRDPADLLARFQGSPLDPARPADA